MRITELQLKNYRNVKELVLEPDAGINIIYGENAQGKTNILEAIWLFSGLKSFRGAKDGELVNFDAGTAKLKLDFQTSARTNKAEIIINGRRNASLNGVELKSPSELIGKFRAVVFAPSFLSIVQDGPGERRRFLDAAVCQLRPGYAVLLSEYNRLVKQRNSLLKDVTYDASLLDVLDVLDEKTAELGERLIAERSEYLDRIKPFVCDIYGGLSSGKEEISFEYVKKYAEGKNTALRDIFRENRKEDILNKTTSAGPHRDDIEIYINGISARLYGSQGQQRSCALALKLGEASVIKEQTGEQPVALLDDVMSELDTNRQDYILNHIRDWQVFITCCEPSSVLRMCSGKTMNIENGRLTGCI